MRAIFHVLIAGTCESKILAAHQDLAFDVVFCGAEMEAVRCVRLITLELE